MPIEDDSLPRGHRMPERVEISVMATGPDFRMAFRFLASGIEFVCAFGLCAAGGVYLDGRLGGGTLWPIIGGAIGFALGLWMMIRMVKQYRSDADRKDNK